MTKEYGSLTVRAYTAGGGLPVAGAKVKIKGGEEENKNIYYELITDRSGNTETVTLPAPVKDYSLSPEGDTAPYALYDLEITKDGYYEKRIIGLTVFSGVASLQLINMIPLSEGGGGEFPRGSINTVIPENTDLN